MFRFTRADTSSSRASLAGPFSVGLAHVHYDRRQQSTAVGKKELRVRLVSPGGTPRGDMPTWRDEIAKMTPAQVCRETEMNPELRRILRAA